MQESFHFVAMEYYALILNRTYFISVDASGVIGKVCRGLTAVEAGAGLTRLITSQMAVRGNLDDPNSYISDQKLERPSSADFTIQHGEITDILFNPKKKWGMGPYPHDGRVTIATTDKRREFIILGKQSGLEIAERISEITRRANNSFKPTPLRGVV